VNEFELAGLTPQASSLVKPPREAESPVAFECKLSQLIRLRGANGVEVDSWMVLGEVIGVHIAANLLIDGVYDTAAAHPVLRGGGPADYFEIDIAQRFRMFRPR
jgi:flavin reductase (DIM6/NTAB) family NADH-FMN oxidoreductase RutF